MKQRLLDENLSFILGQRREAIPMLLGPRRDDDVIRSPLQTFGDRLVVSLGNGAARYDPDLIAQVR